ncbi:MAG: PilZ domain-containing protein [Planctomycetes bacterium]|nr:PilZ domain-containing protein [Planctomycetota bacterium]
MAGSDTHAETYSATTPTKPPTEDARDTSPCTVTPSGDVSAEQIFEELHNRFGSGDAVSNERHSERLPWVTNLTVRVEDPGRTARALSVATHDVSRGGFSFIYRQFLHRGTRIRTEFNALPNRPTIRGIVQYCVDIGDGRHRIGVRFAHDSSARAVGKSRTDSS